MRKEYNKLVRDHIPSIIQGKGHVCETRILDEPSYLLALRTKLMEEAQEAATCSTEELVIELADLYEVIDALSTAAGITKETLIAEQGRRRTERGAFDHRILLLAVEET